MSAAELLTDLGLHGITLEVDGTNLRYYAVEGALTRELREQIKAHKPELLVYLTKDAANTIANPAGLCPHCGCGQWWQQPGEAWYCRACKPDMPLGATTLTLPCHKVQTRPVRDRACLRRMVELACGRLTITPEQLWKELEANGDLADLESGAVSVKARRQVAVTLATMREQKIPERGSWSQEVNGVTSNTGADSSVVSLPSSSPASGVPYGLRCTRRSNDTYLALNCCPTHET